MLNIKKSTICSENNEKFTIWKIIKPLTPMTAVIFLPTFLLKKVVRNNAGIKTIKFNVLTIPIKLSKPSTFL